MVLITILLTLASILFCEFAGGVLAKEINLAWLKKNVRGKLVLTYDDGPGPRLESRLMTLLKEKNARATFFLNAKRSLEHGDRVRVLKDAGHEVACHTFEHLNAWRTSPWHVVWDIGKAYGLLDDWLTTRSIYRPPHGKITASVWLLLAAKGIRVALWTHDSGDTFVQLPEGFDTVADVSRAGGGVVLMHSFDRHGADAERREQYVIELTNQLLELARQNHWQVCSFCELPTGR